MKNSVILLFARSSQMMVLTFIFWGASTLYAAENLEAMNFEAKLCTDHQNGASFTFLNANDDSKDFSFDLTDNTIYMSHPDWNHRLTQFDAIEFIRLSSLDHDKKYMTIVLKEPRGFFKTIKELEFGVMDTKCWNLLVDKMKDNISIQQL